MTTYNVPLEVLRYLGRARFCRVHGVKRDAQNSCSSCVDANAEWTNAKFPKNPNEQRFGHGYRRKWSSGQPDADKHREQQALLTAASARRRGG